MNLSDKAGDSILSKNKDKCRVPSIISSIFFKGNEGRVREPKFSDNECTLKDHFENDHM